MFPALQPSRPKVQQPSSRPPHAQQSRTTHHEPQKPHTSALEAVRPRSQIEAMPPSPFGAAQKQPLFQPPRGFYDAAVRHPVFFTEQLRKPPFPIPEAASQGWSPVASGYIAERGRGVGGGVGRTKL
ncbi:hypothetical protein BS50DRAFT_613484 [Corynespora cassiicola Philippines]|uniref:Uncharacterized protein n=1 Tax=Corynespora cassiicola Philippines TaxID=1448308 RepID=A0A2T2N905_CORCC|nr:hypothetical protein BS50DRAFT_613484 [Corynespora cassiicola Philippines]